MTIATIVSIKLNNPPLVHGIDQDGKRLWLTPEYHELGLPELIADLQPCVIGMEACSEAHNQASCDASGTGGSLRPTGAEKRTDSFSRWDCSLVERRGYWRVVVAIAAKNAAVLSIIALRL